MQRAIQQLVITAAAHLLCVTLVHGQTIRVGDRVLVARGSEQDLLVEPHLSVASSDPNQLLGAMIVSSSVPKKRASEDICASLLSLNGGKTWTRHNFAITGCVDPWTTITPDGRAVFMAVGSHAALGSQGRVGLIVFGSADGGRTWDEQPIGLGPIHDHPTTAVDFSSPERRGWVYVVSHHAFRGEDGQLRWSVFVARSRDAGKTFDKPVKIVPNNVHNIAEMPAVLSNGTVIISFVDVGYNQANTAEEGGFDRRRAWVMRSTDGGQTFSIPLFVNDECGPPPGFQLSALAVDTSTSPFRDRLYFACKQHGGGPILLNYSMDGGETWTKSVAVQSPPSNSSVKRVPGLAVNNRGVLGVAWIDRRSPSGARCQEVYFTASLDGGRTFLPEQSVSSAACPDSAEKARGWSTSGDYFGMVATPDGRFRLLWAEAHSVVPHLWTATVEVQSAAVDRK